MPHLRLLGGAFLEDEEGVVTGAAARRHPLALLAVLSTAPSRTLARSRIVGLLWPDASESRARNRLNACVHRARTALGKDGLISAGDDLRLNAEALTCDLWQFREALEEEDYRKAVERYDGPFLDGFRLGDSPTFEKWMDQERARLGREYREALEALAEAAEERGEAAAAAGWWRERANEDPYDSRVVRRLMEALVASGNRAAALRAARAHGRLLREELGASPDPAVDELAERLRTEEEPAKAGSGGGGKPEEPARATFPASNLQVEVPGGREEAFEPADSGGRPAGSGLPVRTAAALLVLAAVGFGAWMLVGEGGVEEIRTTGRTVAVFPFDVLGEDRDEDFGSGIHAGLLSRLASVSDIQVISGTSVRRYRGTEKSLPEIARELDAGWVLEGELHRVGDGVQVNAQLVNPRTDTEVWAESYRRDSLTARTAFRIQEGITRGVVNALDVELGPEEERRVASVPTENTAAYELYLQARRLRSEIPGLGAVGRQERRIELLRRSLALDPALAEAWAALASTYKARAWREWSPVWADSARRAARRALELNPELADAYSYLGDAYWVLGDRAAQLEAYRTALTLQPGHPHASNNLVAFLGFWGRLAEQAKWLDTLLHASPHSPWIVGNLVTLNSMLGREAVADAWREYARSHGISTRRVDFHLRLGRGHVKAARTLFSEIEGSETNDTYLSRRRAALALYQGAWTRARRIYRELYGGAAPGSSHPVFQSLLDDRLGLAWSLRELGQMEEAREIAARVRKSAEDDVRGAERGYPPLLRLAVSNLILGDTARALGWLDAAVDVGYRDRETLETVPTLAPLRAHPRFRTLVARVDSLLAEERRRVEAGGWGEPPGRAGGGLRASSG